MAALHPPEEASMRSMTDTTLALPPTTARPTLAAVLLFDAATCAGMGVLLLVATQLLATMLGLPAVLLSWAGVLLLPCAALMLMAGRQRPPAAALVMLIVLGNLAWVVASAYVALGVSGITVLGQVFVWAQALVVLVLAWMEWRGLASRQR
jgi:hypothetical protein